MHFMRPITVSPELQEAVLFALAYTRQCRLDVDIWTGYANGPFKVFSPSARNTRKTAPLRLCYTISGGDVVRKGGHAPKVADLLEQGEGGDASR